MPVLFLAIILLGFRATNLQNQIQKNNSQNAQIQTLLTGTNKAAGYTCGVLNSDKAKELLNSDSVEKNFGQGPTDEVKQGEPNPNNIFWADNCRYQDSVNSTKYVELLISTFQSSELAKNSFLDFIPVVNEKKYINASGYGQELIYDSGVFYLLQDNRVLQISTGNGNPSETESFSTQVFKYLLPDIRL
jgi:hypothetical protein